MGLIEFVKDVGQQLGVGDTPPAQSAQAPATPPGSEAQQVAALVRLVEQMGLTVEELGIQVDGERVTLRGTADSQETREKVVLLVGNVQGVGQVDDQRQVAQPAPEARFYTVKRGDTLSKIAAAGSGAGDTRTPTCTADQHTRGDVPGHWHRASRHRRVLLMLMLVHL
jgi:nucleoid-associated protein YgaU